MSSPVWAIRRNFSILLSCFLLFIYLGAQLNEPVLAAEKHDAALTSEEGMKEHASDGPRRVMHDALYQEFNRGNLFNIVTKENIPRPLKNFKARYFINGNLIAFTFKPNEPVRVSVSIQLADHEARKKILTSDEAIDLDGKLIQSSLKLHGHEFDVSPYGKALDELTKRAVHTFESKAAKLNLER